MSVAAWIAMGLLDLVVALLLLGVFYQWRGQIFTLLRFRAMRGDDPGPPLTRRPRWVSTQPAPNPGRLPRPLSQRMGPFPMTPHGGDWNFFCYVHVAPGRPVRIRGKLTACRGANLTLYYPEHLRGERREPPPSLDARELKLEDGNSYEIIISHEPSDPELNRLEPGGNRHLMLALRHYVFENGTDIHYPEIWWGDELILPGQVSRGVRSIFPRRGHVWRREPARRRA